MAASFSAERVSHSIAPTRPKSSPHHVPPLPDSLNKFSIIDKLSHSVMEDDAYCMTLPRADGSHRAEIGASIYYECPAPGGDGRRK